MITWVLVLHLITTTAPSFLSPYPSEEVCTAARDIAVRDGGRNVRAAFCLPIGGPPTAPR